MVTPADFAPRAWYRASDSGVVNGVFVATDLSGNGRNATQATASRQPSRVYRPTGIYSWAWQFDGTDDYLQGHTDVVAAQQAQTVIALAKLTGSSTTRRAWGFGAFYSLFANESQWAYYANTGSALVNFGGNTGDWTVVAVRQFTNEATTYFPQTITTYDVSSTPFSGRTLYRVGTHNGKPLWRSNEFELDPGDNRYFELSWQIGDDSYWTLVLWSQTYTLVSWVNNTATLFLTDGFVQPSNEYEDITLLPPETPMARASRNAGSNAATWLPYNTMSSPQRLAIGAEGWNPTTEAGTQVWPGLVAEVVVIDDYLSVTEIQDLYANYFYPRYFAEPSGVPARCRGRLSLCGLGL